MSPSEHSATAVELLTMLHAGDPIADRISEIPVRDVVVVTMLTGMLYFGGGAT